LQWGNRQSLVTTVTKGALSEDLRYRRNLVPVRNEHGGCPPVVAPSSLVAIRPLRSGLGGFV
jgi:hypothetical protein